MQAAREALGGFLQQQQVTEIKQKYHDLNSLSAAQKVEAVKDTNLNPFLFDDPSDGLANSMWRWAKEAPGFTTKSQTEKDAIAGQYYDQVLQPLYQKAGAAPLSRENWMRNAWGTALTYDTKQSYRAPLLKGILEGADSAISEVANVGRTLTNIGRMPIVGYADSVKHGDYTGLTGFYNLYVNMHNRVQQEGVATGIAKTIEETGEKNVLGFGSSKWLHDVASSEEFWKTVTPQKTFTEKATSFTVENAMLLPLFTGIGEATKLGIGLVKTGTEGVPYIENLSKVLQASKPGKIAAKMLTFGTEGLIYGDLTRDTEDKHNAWKDALQFAAFGTLMSYAGGKASKLVDMLPESAEKEAIQAAEKEAGLGAQGKRAATPEEYFETYRAHMASVMAAGGRPLAHSILEEALAHVALDEKAPMSEMDKLRFRQDKMDEDPEHWKTVFSNMTIIKQFLKQQGWKLTEFDDAKWGDLKGFLDGQLDKAGEEIDLHVPEVQEMKAQDLLNTYMQTPEGKAEYQEELQKASEVLKGHPGAEQKAPILAKDAMLKRRIKAVRRAAEARTVEGPENVRANSKSSRVKKPTPLDPKTARRVVKSRYERDVKGRITGYSYSISHDWKVAADKAAAAKGGKNTTKFWNDYIESLTAKNDDDVLVAHALVEDLRDYFNPVKKYKLQFEKSNTEGGDWTNFLGFMYSYRHELPKPVADKIEDILLDSPKMRSILGSKPTVKKLTDFAQSMQNHIEIFLRSDWFQKKGELNIFRSSTPEASGPESLSKWQADKKLILSAHRNEIAAASQFYPGKSIAMQEAKAQYTSALQILHAKELDAYLKGKPNEVAKIMKQIQVRINLAASGEVE